MAKISNKMRKACLGKVQHGSQSGAQTALDLMPIQPGHELEVYQCKFCKFWHIGHSKGSEKYGTGIGKRSDKRKQATREPKELFSRTKVAQELIQMAYALQQQQVDLERLHVLTNNKYFADLIDRTQMLAVKIRHQSECMGASWTNDVNNPKEMYWTATISGREILPLVYHHKNNNQPHAPF